MKNGTIVPRETTAITLPCLVSGFEAATDLVNTRGILGEGVHDTTH
jgi:hypothetical protein